MKTDAIDNDFLQSHIPNAIITVEGEPTLLERLTPFIDSACTWLESEYIGTDDFLNEMDHQLALETVFHKAFADAIPSLDLTLTPTGFGVVSTEAVSPASKERVERLIESHRNKAYDALSILIEYCHQYKEWRESERGKYFCATFLDTLKDYRRMAFDSFDEMRNEALHVEALMEEKYFGHSLMARLRDEYCSRKPYVVHPVADRFNTAVKNVVYRINKSLEQALWEYCRPIVDILPRYKDYYDIWQKEMGEYYENSIFQNKIPGAFYF